MVDRAKQEEYEEKRGENGSTDNRTSSHVTGGRRISTALRLDHEGRRQSLIGQDNMEQEGVMPRGWWPETQGYPFGYLTAKVTRTDHC